MCLVVMRGFPTQAQWRIAAARAIVRIKGALLHQLVFKRGGVPTEPLYRHRSYFYVGKGFHENHRTGVDPEKARLPRQSCLARLTRGTDRIVTQV